MNDLPQGTVFQRRVWSELLKIPHGQTRSYNEIANACSKNPIPKQIPCHRAIRSDGSIGGYSGPGGISEKIRLIEKEKEILEERYETGERR